MSYRNFVPAPNCFGNCPNPQGIFYNPLLAGAPCPPSHPNTQAPPCAPNPPPTIPIPGLSANFIANMNSGFNRFGCQFIYKRTDIQSTKLRLLQNSINPNSTIGTLLEPILLDYAQGVLQGPPPLPPSTGGPTPPPIGTGTTTTGTSAPTNPNYSSFGGWSNQSGMRAQSGGTSLPPINQGLTSGGYSGGVGSGGTPPPGSGGQVVQCVNCASQGGGIAPPPLSQTFLGNVCPSGWTQSPSTGNPYGNCPTPGTNIYMQAWTIFTTPIQPAGTVGTNPNWQQMLQNRINWLNNFALQNCTGGPTPPPTPPTPPMVTCSTCSGGNPISNMFPNSCPPGWSSGNSNPCLNLTGGGGTGTGGPTPPPNFGTGGGVVNNGFTSF